MLKIEKVSLPLVDITLYPELNNWEISIKPPDSIVSPLSKSKEEGANGTKLWETESTDKPQLRLQLHREQEGFCAYCGQRLLITDFPIEHLIPKSKYPYLTFIYHNLVASCEGNEPIKTQISISNAIGKTIREVFKLQQDINDGSKIFSSKHTPKYKIVNIVVNYNTLPSITIKGENDPKMDSVVIDKKTIKSVEFRWATEKDKHCDAYKGDDNLYLLPLTSQTIKILHQYLPENEHNNFISIEDNITFKTKGEVEFAESLKPLGFKSINEVLNLNQTDLVNKRKRIYDNTIQKDFEDIIKIEDLEEKEIVVREKIKLVEENKEEFYFMKSYFLSLFLTK
jgi:uncharacterized protein (TIGR02646 family)